MVQVFPPVAPPMPTRFRRRSRLTLVVLPLILCAVAIYFGWQGTRGTYGQEARMALANERIEKAAALETLVAEREALEAKVAKLRSDRLDADLLDERARAKLNLAHTNEIVIFHAMDPVLKDAMPGR